MVLSMSALQAFKRCRRSYLYGYEMLLEPRTSSNAANFGSDFHEMMECAAKKKPLREDFPPEVYMVGREYLDRHPLPENILLAEEPIYTKLLPDVWLRTTFDLVYKDKDGYIVGRDYKTFSKAPTLDVDLDFQGRIYTAALQKHYGTKMVRFEYEYVRSEIGRDLKKGYQEWPIEDRYFRVPVYVAHNELEELWAETQDVARDLLRASEEKRWYRQDLKVGPHSCTSCFYRAICQADLAQGGLDEQTINLLATKREQTEE